MAIRSSEEWGDDRARDAFNPRHAGASSAVSGTERRPCRYHHVDHALYRTSVHCFTRTTRRASVCRMMHGTSRADRPGGKSVSASGKGSNEPNAAILAVARSAIDQENLANEATTIGVEWIVSMGESVSSEVWPGGTCELTKQSQSSPGLHKTSGSMWEGALAGGSRADRSTVAGTDRFEGENPIKKVGGGAAATGRLFGRSGGAWGA